MKKLQSLHSIEKEESIWCQDNFYLACCIHYYYYWIIWYNTERQCCIYCIITLAAHPVNMCWFGYYPCTTWICHDDSIFVNIFLECFALLQNNNKNWHWYWVGRQCSGHLIFLVFPCTLYYLTTRILVEFFQWFSMVL